MRDFPSRSRENSTILGWTRTRSTFFTGFPPTIESDSAPDPAGKRVPLEEEQHEHREDARGEGELVEREVAVVARAEIRVV